jgi:uroporphyrin-3 C-methyltransferase
MRKGSKMTDKNRVKDKTTKSENVKTSKGEGKPKKISPVIVLVFFILIVLLLGIVYKLFYSSTVASKISPKVSVVKLNEKSKKALSDSPTETKQENQEKEVKETSAVSERAELKKTTEEISEMKKALAVLQAKSDDGSSQWLIGRAEHLAELAQFSLLYERDNKTALALLQRAEKLIERTNDLRVLPVKKALINDISRLRNHSEKSMTHVYLELSSLQDQANELALKGKQVRQKPKTDISKKEKSWKDTLKQSMKRFRGLIVIRHQTKGFVPIMEGSTQGQVRIILQSIFFNIQWAVLHREPTIFKKNIEKAQAWLSQYYDSKNEKTKTLVIALGKMKKIHVKPEWPSIEKSIVLLQKAASFRFTTSNKKG